MTDASHAGERDTSGVNIPPPLIYVAVFAGAVVLDSVLPVAELPEKPSRVLAGILVFLWAILDLGSMAFFRRARTGVAPTQPSTTLVTWGPYRYTRNPMYLGMVLLYVGVALWFSVVWALLLAPLLILIVYRYVIAKEELYLDRTFGEEYRRYRARVRRCL